MLNDSLYTKYRPKTFDEVYGQKYISEILKNQVKSKKFTHAYLFSGTRGTGKTTCARIFSKAVNCLNSFDGNPCYNCSMCLQKNSDMLNVIELDAASNNSVEQIRNLIEELRYANFVGGYKIYILDEVHMLSISAFNALLKTLEEPPKNVLFILSTTEIKKIPHTVVSRCQRFEFRNIELLDIASRLRYIAENEKIQITDDCLELIGNLGNGSMRDAITILEKILIYKDVNISTDDVRDILGITSTALIIDFFKGIFEKDLGKCLTIISKLFIDDVEIKNFITDFRNVVRDLMFLKIEKLDFDLLVEKNKENISNMIEVSKQIEFRELTYIVDGLNEICSKNLSSDIEYRIYLEMFVIKLIEGNSNYEHQNFYQTPKVKIKSDRKEYEDKFKEKEGANFNLKSWSEFLDYLKKSSFMVLYSLLLNGDLSEASDNKLKFKCNTEGILNRLKDENTINQIQDNLFKYFNKKFEFIVYFEGGVKNLNIEDKIKSFFGEDIEIENK